MQYRRKQNQEDTRKELDAMIQQIAETYVEDPKNIQELLKFNSQFYRYSLKNTMLIQHQNPGAVFVQSYTDWKKMGVLVKGGEKGMKIYRPEEATILKIDNHLVPLEQATDEQKAAYKKGEIESTTKRYFRLGYVFDIAQTNFPKEKLPKYFFMGYASEQHQAIAKGLEEYAKQELGCSVKTENLESISQRGYYKRDTKEIVLNELLEDSQRLSTLAHELGHAIVHEKDTEKSTVQKELEADALGIMLEMHFGIEPTEGRQRHLAENFRGYQELYTKEPEMKGTGAVLYDINLIFRKVISQIEGYVEKETGISMEKRAMLEQVQRQERMEKEMGKKQLFGEIKSSIQIMDYAAMHGMETKRVGRYYTLKDYDSVRIDPQKNCFYRNSGIGTNTAGSVIDFAMEFVHNGDKHQALTELEGMLGRENVAEQRHLQKQHENQLPDLSSGVVLPEKNHDMRRVYAYLIKSRYLDQDIVQDFIDRKMLYQDMRGNCVFVAYGKDGEPNYGTFRGTLTGKKFLGDVPGNDYAQGFYIDHNAEKMVVTESVIDAMSVMSVLHRQGQDYKAYDYLVLTGTGKTEPVLNHLREKPMKEVLLSLDHDNAGVRGMEMITDQIRQNLPETEITYHIPNLNDWNEELSNAGKKLYPFSSISYLENKELPLIHPCAIQSTEHIEETGFRVRDEKHQYRLVELDENGNFLPMQVGRRNVIYFRPEDLEKLVPNLYELVPYESLLAMQESIQQKERNTQEISLSDEKESDLPILASQTEESKIEPRFYADSGVVMVQKMFDGKNIEEGNIWKKADGTYVVSTGYAFDNTIKEYLLGEKEIQELERILEISVSEFPEGLLYDECLENKNLEEVKQMRAEVKKPVMQHQKNCIEITENSELSL